MWVVGSCRPTSSGSQAGLWPIGSLAGHGRPVKARARRATEPYIGPCRAGKALCAPTGRPATPNATRADAGARGRAAASLLGLHGRRAPCIVHRRARTTATVHAPLLHCCCQTEPSGALGPTVDARNRLIWKAFHWSRRADSNR